MMHAVMIWDNCTRSGGLSFFVIDTYINNDSSMSLCIIEYIVCLYVLQTGRWNGKEGNRPNWIGIIKATTRIIHYRLVFITEMICRSSTFINTPLKGTWLIYYTRKLVYLSRTKREDVMGCSVTRIKSLCSSATGQIPATPLRTPTVLFFPFYQSTCRISSLSSFLSLIYFFLSLSLTTLLG